MYKNSENRLFFPSIQIIQDDVDEPAENFYIYTKE